MQHIAHQQIARHHIARAVAVVVLAWGAQSASAACYYVYSSSQQLLYRSQAAPVDLALPLHETVPQLGPGLSLVFTQSNSGCYGTLDMLQSYRSSQAARKVSVKAGPRTVR